jgi:hypothetical protein
LDDFLVAEGCNRPVENLLSVWQTGERGARPGKLWILADNV